VNRRAFLCGAVLAPIAAKLPASQVAQNRLFVSGTETVVLREWIAERATLFADTFEMRYCMFARLVIKPARYMVFSNVDADDLND